MDLKQKLIDEVLLDMQGVIGVDKFPQLQMSLTKHLHGYDLSIAETKDLPQTIDDCNQNALKRFLLAKTIQGSSENTIRMYQYRLEYFFNRINKSINEIDSDDLRFYLGKLKMETKCSNTTLENNRLILSSFFKWCHNEEIISKNPMSKLSAIKKDTFKEKPFSHTEQELLTIACETDRDRALLEFLLSTGCRVSEVVSVNRNQIDIYSKQLTVVGKGNKERTVYLTDKSLVYIKKYLDGRTDKNEALFVSEKKPHDRLSVDGVENILKKIGKKANVQNVHPHRFRRTLCNTLADKGMPIQNVKEILGHDSIDTTMIYYNSNNSNIKNEFHSKM
jgi:site-specific recombinase XerD